VATDARPHTIQVTGNGETRKLREALKPVTDAPSWQMGPLTAWPLAPIAPRSGITVALPAQAIDTDVTIIIDY
jgi:hypothetical protein